MKNYKQAIDYLQQSVQMKTALFGSESSEELDLADIHVYRVL